MSLGQLVYLCTQINACLQVNTKIDTAEMRGPLVTTTLLLSQ